MKTNVASLLIAGGLAVVATSAFAENVNDPAKAPAEQAADRKMVPDSLENMPADAKAPADTVQKKMPAPENAANVPPDNSGKNVRDRADTALTPGDQSSKPEDVAITQQLRKAVVNDPNLSVNAQNVKIITIDGVVTLRGPVKNASEKEAIAAKARSITGVSRVDNQIELAGE